MNFPEIVRICMKLSKNESENNVEKAEDEQEESD